MAGAGPFSRSDFQLLYARRLPFIRELIGNDKWTEAEQQWKHLYDVDSSNRLREEDLMHAGLGHFSQIGENEKVTYDNIVEGPKQTYTHLLYGLGYQIGYLSGKHDLDGIVKKHAPALGRSMRMSVQWLAAGWWNDAWDNSLTADGLSYFNASHTFIRGGSTFANRPGSATTLGRSALESALVAFRNMKDLNGDPMPLTVESLLISPTLEPIAHELLQSKTRTDTTTDTASFVYNKLTPFSWPFLTVTTAWALLGPKKDRTVKWFWNIKPETSHGFEFDAAVAKTKTLFACSFGATDPRGAYGDKGV